MMRCSMHRLVLNIFAPVKRDGWSTPKLDRFGTLDGVGLQWLDCPEKNGETLGRLEDFEIACLVDASQGIKFTS